MGSRRGAVVWSAVWNASHEATRGAPGGLDQLAGPRSLILFGAGAFLSAVWLLLVLWHYTNLGRRYSITRLALSDRAEGGRGESHTAILVAPAPLSFRG